MLLLKPVEVAALVRLVQFHHAAFVFETFGEEASGMDREQIADLTRLGILDPAHSAALAHDPIGDAWISGMVLARLAELADQQPEQTAANLTYSGVEEELRRDPVPLGPVERRAIQSARNSAGQYCRGLGNRVDEQMRTIAINADDVQAAAFRGKIQDATAEAVARRSSISHLRSEIGHASGDWARDLERIAETELHNAHENGIAGYIEKESGTEAAVAKLPNPGACKDCARLYTTDGTTPRTFPLAELRANGTNSGKKKAAWLPTIEAAHPRCMCTLVSVPDGYAFSGRRLVHESKLPSSVPEPIPAVVPQA